MEEQGQLEPRALDARIAELLRQGCSSGCVSRARAGDWDRGVPHFSTAHAHAHLLGDMLYDRGLWQPYIEALIDITGAGMTIFTTAIEIGDVGDAWRSLYNLMQATPCQRALAALRALSAGREALEA